MLNGSLFTRDFLIEGMRGTDAWAGLDEATAAAFRMRLESLLKAFGKMKIPTEAETEKELIWPLLEAIGWSDLSVQQNLSVKARDDVPDALLFGDAAAKAKAASLEPWQRFQHGVCVVEAKRWKPLLPGSVGVQRLDGVIAITDVRQNRHEPSAEARGKRPEPRPHPIEVVQRGVEAADAKEVIDERGAIAQYPVFVPVKREQRIDVTKKAADRAR